MKLKINEIFHSIQGESSYAGFPCVFIRLTGCNLRCIDCDTKYAYFEGSDMEIDEIIKKVSLMNCKLVEITGGEPLVQKNTNYLINSLLKKRFHVLLETNGSKDISEIDKKCIKIIDIKCPSTGEEKSNYFENFKYISQKDEIKFVIGERDDYCYAVDKLKELNLKNNLVHFSTIYGKIQPKTLAEWILHDKINVKLQLQLHKIIWNPNKRGV